MYDTFTQDLRYAWRALRGRPGYATVAVLTIALGLGANIAIFGVINTVFFRPLPFDTEDRLMRVQEFSVAPDGTRRRVSALGATFELVRDNVDAFDAVVAQTGGSSTLDAGAGAERVSTGFVSEGWGRLLGLEPAIGRHFTDDEAQVGQAARVVLVGHALWQRHLGGRPEAVGTTIRLSGLDYTVVGVMPEGFRFPYDAEVWMPAQFPPDRGLYVLARLAPGVTLDQANQQLAAIGSRIGELFPNRAGMGVDAHSARTNIQQGQDRLAVALMGAVGFLLLIACANVAMLLAARFATQRKEIAVRAALGCGRLRQVRHFLTESLLLFSLGGAAGLLLTLWATDWLTALVPRVLATQLAMGEVAVDLRVGVFAAALTLTAGLLFGTVAAARASSANLTALMKEGGRSATAGSRRTLGTLVVVEIALAVVLLTGAGLMTSAFQRLQDQNLGFQPEGLLTFRFDLLEGRYTDGGVRLDTLDRIRRRLAAEPGIRSVGAITVNPLCCGDWGARVVIEGQPPASPGATPVVFHRFVSPGLLETMGIRLLEGRLFTAQDTAQSEPVAIVDEHFARRYFPGRTAIGGRVKRAPYDSAGPWLTIVGVVADAVEEGDYLEGWYLPYAQDPTGPSADNVHMMVRAEGDPLALVVRVREAVAESDRGLAPYDFTTLDRIRTESLRQDRIGTVLIVLFAAFGLLLATVGVYGLMAFAVAQQTREIGIRLALGAGPSRVLRQIVGRGLRLAAVGLLLGAGGALLAARVLASLLEDVRAADPLTLASAAVMLALAVFAACVVPAWRALRINPVEILRTE